MLGTGSFVSAQFDFKVQSNCGGSSETAFTPRMPQCVSPWRRPQKVKPPNQFLRGERRALARKPQRSQTRSPSNREAERGPSVARAVSRGRHVLGAARANAVAPRPAPSAPSPSPSPSGGARAVGSPSGVGTLGAFQFLCRAPGIRLPPALRTLGGYSIE